MATVIDEHTQFLDSSGAPIVNGYIYIGTQNLDPKTNTISIYSDRALTDSLTNPQRTDSNGRTVNKIWVAETFYSIKVEDSSNVQQYLNLDNGSVPTTEQGTETATTSGTTVDITGVPSWAKRIDILFEAVGTSGTDDILIKIGDAGGIESSGYVSFTSELLITPAINNATSTAGFRIYQTSIDLTGTVSLYLKNSSNNTWTVSGILCGGVSVMVIMAGDKDLSAALDRIQLTTVGGTDTFNGGSVNTIYS